MNKVKGERIFSTHNNLLIKLGGTSILRVSESNKARLFICFQ